MTKSLLGDAFDHHVWATLRLIDGCLPLNSEQLDTTVPGTYGSILGTMRHLVGADASYLYALTAGAIQPVDEDTLDLGELRDVMAAHRQAWATLLSTDLDPDAVVVRRRADGAESRAPAGIRLAQAVHHGTDHRSQICTALTSLGFDPPAIDVWDYAWDHDLLEDIPPPSQ